jgi:pyruvate dehydrogenase E2 component (dihydrolipoamide acetyltransferase)
VVSYVIHAVNDGEEDLAPGTQTIDIGDISIRYARRGDPEGTPVLFIHGFGGDLDNWLFNIDAIAEKTPVIALDLPGHGQSSVRLPGTSLVDLANFIVRFLDAIDVPAVHVVGHSLGGGIAAQLALGHSARVASLVLIDSAGLGSEINSDYTGGFVSAASRRDLKPVLEQLFCDPTLVSRQLVDDVLKYKRMDGVTELLTSLSSALFGGGLQKETPGLQLGGSDKPVLVLWGREDRVIPAAHAGHVHPGAVVEILDQAGHMVQMERANDVNRLILKHLASG